MLIMQTVRTHLAGLLRDVIKTYLPEEGVTSE